MDIKSPLTGQNNVKLEEEFPVSIIIKKYQQDLNIDVTRFFNCKTIKICKCLITGFRFYYPFEIFGDEQLYKELQKIEGYYSKWNWEHEVAYRTIKQENKVLEVGCGTGNFIKKLKQNGIKAYGLELNNEAVKICNMNGLDAYNEVLNQHIKNQYEKYDVICSFQVLEHIVDPRSFIFDCISAVKPGGKIIFGVPNNNPYLFKRDKYHTLNLPPHHMGLWSVDTFKKISNLFNIKVNAILVEDLKDKKYYFNTLLKYYGLSFAKPIFNRMSDSVLAKLAKLLNWKGRNIVAIFEKC